MNPPIKKKGGQVFERGIEVRQKIFREFPSDNCDGCYFLGRYGCTVPGNTCIYREIKGVPGRYVGDVLKDCGIIKNFEFKEETKEETKE